MKVTYDPRQNIAYIGFKKKTEQVTTIKISESLNVDLSPDGTLYGIELLNANEQLKSDDKGNLIFVNVALDTQKEISLN